MKKIIPIIFSILAVGLIVFVAVMLFRTSNIDSVEIVGDIQTIYFVDSTNTANFNDASLKITYSDGSVKIKKLSYKNVSVKNFSTAVANNGVMKITYKSKTIDVGYSVVWTGMYYLTEKTNYTFNGSSISKSTSGPYVAGVNDSNQDKTTSLEMIYFNDDGTCDYYSRTSSSGTWYMDDSYYDKSFYYKIEGNTINAHLGDEKVYSLKAKVSSNGEMTLQSTENSYVSNEDVTFIKTITERNFDHYEMKGNRTIERGDIEVYCSSTISFSQGSKFNDSNLNIYLKVNYKNDNFLKNVYVRFNETMFISDKEFSTSVKTITSTSARCFYDGVYFELIYKVI